MSTLRSLYTVRELPIFQNRMFDTAAAAQDCPRGNVVLMQDTRSGLIFNQAFRPELMKYDAAYQNEQAVSAVFQRHLHDVARIISTHLSGKKLIEVGCGKGYFLEQLQALDFDITGLDPTYEGNNPAIVKEYFTAATGLRADGLVLRHVLEHVIDPVQFLRNIREANGGAGTIYIEVPCFDWICERHAWFDVFYEHVNYFRLDDFHRMFGTVHESGRIFGGQYLFVVADLGSLRTPMHTGQPYQFPSDFLATVERYAQRLRAGDKCSAVWGGASKGVLFSLFMERAGALPDLVIDINPAKHGKYLPATGLQVSRPERALQSLPAGSDVFVMNGNYLQEIKTFTQNRFNYLTVDHASL